MQNIELYILLTLIGIGIGLSAREFWPKIRDLLTRDTKEDNKKTSDISRLYNIAASMSDYFQKTANPGDLLDSDDFQRGVKLLQKNSIAKDKVIEYGEGDNDVIACMAFRALLSRDLDEDDVAKIINTLEDLGPWPYYYALQAINKSENKVLGAVLATAQDWWPDNKYIIQATNDFINNRIKKGDVQSFEKNLERLDESDIESVNTFLKALDAQYTSPFLDELKKRDASSLDVEYLNFVGRVWDDSSFKDIIVEHEALEQNIKNITESLFSAPERSVLIIGESGVGKSALLQVLFKRLEKNRWRIFQASAVDVIAGQSYIGDLEGRIQNLIKKLNVQKRVLW